MVKIRKQQKPRLKQMKRRMLNKRKKRLRLKRKKTPQRRRVTNLMSKTPRKEEVQRRPPSQQRHLKLSRYRQLHLLLQLLPPLHQHLQQKKLPLLLPSLLLNQPLLKRQHQHQRLRNLQDPKRSIQLWCWIRLVNRLTKWLSPWLDSSKRSLKRINELSFRKELDQQS